MLPAILAGASLGANLISGIAGTHSIRKRLKHLRNQQLANLRPLEQLLQVRGFGASESQGNIESAVTSRTLGGLAQRGVLNSTIAAPAVASAVAPYEQARQANVQSLTERLVAARNAILEGTSMPGYGQAFGQAFGEAGDLLAYMGGRSMGGGRVAKSRSPLEEFANSLGGIPGAFGKSGGQYWGPNPADSEFGGEEVYGQGGYKDDFYGSGN